MSRYIVLKRILETETQNLSPEYMVFERQFSEGKKLYDFQEEALIYAMSGLKKFFRDLWNDTESEDKEDKEIVNMLNAKKKMWDLYSSEMRYEGVNELHYDLSQLKDTEFADLVMQYLGVGEKELITSRSKKLLPFWYFSNRMSFWMATGSGKTLVIVSLIDSLFTLMQRGIIPKRNVLFLTAREDLIRQFESHLYEFQNYHGRYFDLVSLKDYGRTMQGISGMKLPIFYYRADLFSDQMGDKRIDFRDYEAGGNWYIILDEAHKGDKESSKRQYMYSIMARNGFLFNFSATFDDPRDIVTTAYEYNLSTFIEKGHGKHILVFNEDVPLRRKKRDITDSVFDEEKKKKIVLKKLILLAALRKHYKILQESIKDENIYHMPLGMVLVHSITGKEEKKKELKGWETSDMRLFLKLLIDVISSTKKDDYLLSLIEEAWRELYNNISQDRLVFDENVPDSSVEKKKFLDNLLSENLGDSHKGESILKNIYRYVFGTDTPGNIELIVPKQAKDKEIILKVKSTSIPFALIRVGASAASDLRKWLVEEMGYEESFDVVEKSYFESLDTRPEISLLLGSRAFYEGWDSSRPNIIMFIGMGKSKERKKFILQAVGRGVRIEPLRNKRRRKYFLCKEEKTLDICGLDKDTVFPIETLFVWGTDPEVINDVMESMQEQKEAEGYPLKFIQENVSGEEKRCLFVPTYVRKDVVIPSESKVKFQMSKKEEEIIRKLVKSEIIDRDFLLFHFFSESRGISPLEAVELFLSLFRGKLKENTWLRTVDEDRVRNIFDLINAFFTHVAKVSKIHSMEVALDSVGERIAHFRQIKVVVKDRKEVDGIEEKYNQIILRVNALEQEIKRLTEEGKIKEVIEKSKEIGKLELISEDVTSKDGEKVKLIIRRDLLEHYYIPIVMEDSDKPKVLRNAISHKSEVDFIRDLGDNISLLNEISDEWKFSKIVEKIDNIYIPYFEKNALKKFYPDFIFWFRKGNRVVVAFVDPKGTEHTSAERKIDGYEALFTKNGKPIVFHKNGLDVIFLLYYYSDQGPSSEKYRPYWVSSIKELGDKINNAFNIK